MHLSFPPGTLSPAAQIIPVLFNATGVVAFSKPAETTRIIDEFRKQISEAKPSAIALGIKRPQIVYTPEDELSGIVLFADKDSNAIETWRNAFGSSQLSFTFLLLTKPSEQIEENAFTCELPVAQHFTEPRALISHNTGKKSTTTFYRVEKLGAYELWEAATTFPRFHQVRLHAAECGLPIIGESSYASVPAINVSELRPKKRLNKGDDKPFYAPICLHLARIETLKNTPYLPACIIEAPLPDGFEALLKKLRTKTQE